MTGHLQCISIYRCAYYVNLCAFFHVCFNSGCLWDLQWACLSWLCISVTYTARCVQSAVWPETHTATGMAMHAAHICQLHAGNYQDTFMYMHVHRFLIIIHSSCLQMILFFDRRNTRHAGDYGNPLTECVRQGGRRECFLKAY